MLAVIVALINFFPVFILVNYFCPKLWLSIILTVVFSVIWYFVSLIPIAGDIISIIVWVAAIPFVIMSMPIPVIIIYFAILIFKIVQTIILTRANREK